MKRLALRSLSPFFFCILLAAICACSDDDSDNGAGPDDEIPTDLTDPAAVIASHEQALMQKDYVAYQALLDGEFEFIPLVQDALDFPWLQGSSWDKTEELDIIENMFDPDFSGDVNPTNHIDASFTVLSQQTLPNGRIVVSTIMQGQVLTAADNGWSFDTGIRFELVSREGFLRIAKMQEIDATLTDRSVEANSWGNIKSLYRAPIPTNLTDPAAVIESHERALYERKFNVYSALLDQEFEFYPLEQDAADFPWLDGDSWPKAEELLIIGNMFDRDYDGEDVLAIEVAFTILSQQALSNGRIEVRTVMQGRVLVAPNNGWSFDTVLIFELVSREGFLRIAKITEDYFLLAEGTRVEETSWGMIKASYR